MNGITPLPSSASRRISELLEIYRSPQASLAGLLCDDHAPEAVAYRIIGTDGEVEELSYGTLRIESERFAAALAGLGIVQGDRVATLMGKSREYLVTLMGIWRLGAVHVPLFTAFAPPAIAMRLSGSSAKLVVCDSAQCEKLVSAKDIASEPSWQVVTTGPATAGELNFSELMDSHQPGFMAAKLGGEAPLIHIFTSGTTGKPKGVLVPTKALAAFRAYAEFALDLREGDRYWCSADPGWAYGLYFGILGSLTTGTESLLVEGGFSPERTLSVLAREHVTNFAAAPTVYRALRNSGFGPVGGLSLRCASSAGEPLTPDVNEWAVGALGIPVRDHYGQTEAGMLINNHHHPELRKQLKSGSMGHAMPGWSAAVLHEKEDRLAKPGEVGRIAMELAHSPLAWFGGYVDDPDKSAEKLTSDGRWYVTGDIGRQDEDGYFLFSSRDDDVIIMAGYRIGPNEVETVLLRHPAIAEAAVIAVPDEIRGEVIEAFVVLHRHTDHSDGLEGEIQQWVKAEYAAHAYPRTVHFVPSLPKTPSGKVQRYVLRQQRLSRLRESDVSRPA